MPSSQTIDASLVTLEKVDEVTPDSIDPEGSLGERNDPRYESVCEGEDNPGYRACLLRPSVTLLQGLA